MQDIFGNNVVSSAGRNATEARIPYTNVFPWIHATPFLSWEIVVVAMAVVLMPCTLLFDGDVLVSGDDYERPQCHVWCRLPSKC